MIARSVFRSLAAVAIAALLSGCAGESQFTPSSMSALTAVHRTLNPDPGSNRGRMKTMGAHKAFGHRTLRIDLTSVK